MPVISAIGTALPPHEADNAAVEAAGALWLREDPAQLALFKRFLSSSRTLKRHFIRPVCEVLAQGGMRSRAEDFEREAPRLAEAAVRSALSAANLAPANIDALIFTSCSCPIIPAPDTFLVDRLEFRRDLVRIPAYQFGCAGGVIGLGLAHRLCAKLENVLLVSAELCSLVFHAEHRYASDLVGAAIFGDGAAAAVVTQNPAAQGVEILAHRSFLLPETRHLMGYDVEDAGAHLRLDKELPSHLVQVVPSLVDEFLASHGQRRSLVPWWLFHPGGVKILSSLQEALDLKPHQAPWAGEVLESAGNLSSATILLVLEAFQASKVAAPGDLVTMVGIGPGLTVEMILGRCI